MRGLSRLLVIQMASIRLLAALQGWFQIVQLTTVGSAEYACVGPSSVGKIPAEM